MVWRQNRASGIGAQPAKPAYCILCLSIVVCCGQRARRERRRKARSDPPRVASGSERSRPKGGGAESRRSQRPDERDAGTERGGRPAHAVGGGGAGARRTTRANAARAILPPNQTTNRLQTAIQLKSAPTNRIQMTARTRQTFANVPEPKKIPLRENGNGMVLNLHCILCAKRKKNAGGRAGHPRDYFLLCKTLSDHCKVNRTEGGNLTTGRHHKSC